jgi:hypothetical protein
MPSKKATEVIEAERKVVVKAGEDLVRSIEQRNATEKELQPVYDYLGSRDYDEHRFKEEAKIYVVQSAAASFDAGARLAILKSKMSSADFLRFLESEMPCSERHARRLIAFTGACLSIAKQSGGKLNLNAVKTIGIHKVLAFDAISDLDPEALEKTTIDKLRITPRAELESRIRELETKLEAGKKQIDRHKDSVAKLDKLLREYREHTPDKLEKFCLRFRKNLANAVREFVRAIPDEERPSDGAIMALREVKEFCAAALDSVISTIDEDFPQASTALDPSARVASSALHPGDLNMFAAASADGE